MTDFQKTLDEYSRMKAGQTGQDSNSTDASWNGVHAEIARKQHANMVDQTLGAIASLRQSHSENRARIAGDAEWTPSAKQTRIKALIENSDAALNKIVAGTTDTLQAAIQKSNSAMASAVASKSPDAGTMIRAVEIRRHASEVDPLLLESKVRELALSGDDDEALTAILSASSLKPLLRPEQAQRAKELLADRVAPSHKADSDAAVAALSSITNAKAAAHQSFSNDAERANLGMAIDPIALAARGISIPRADAPGA